jgi:carbon monoxide dehydrogenase subunit G
MASVIKEILVQANPAAVWDAVRDVGEVHRRLVPGLVTNTSLNDGERTVTFANGIILRELIVDIDDAARRFSYAAVGGQVTHHNASIQVLEHGAGQSRIIWTTDILPHEMAGFVRQMVEQAAPIITATLAEKPTVSA